MRVALRFRSNAATIAMIVAAFFVVTASPGAASGLPPVESETSSEAHEETLDSLPRNLLLITLDTTRADVLGCYGATPSPSPNLDQLAEESHVFERCTAPIPLTLPSHVSIFSGLYPSTHGIRKNFGLPSIDSIPLATDVFQKRGFATGAFVSAFVLDRRFGLGRGFDVYQPTHFSHAHGVEAERPGNETVDEAIAWISRQRGPWFAWVHLFDPHTPYAPPEPFASRFPGKPYLGEVAFTDHQVGRLLQALESKQAPSPTSIVICGDHGEGLGDHGEPTHGILVYESTVHVPLIVHLAGQTQGVRHKEPISLVDLAPTLREANGIEGPPSDGVSLWPLLTGQAQKLQSRNLITESLEGFFRSGWSPLFAAIRGTWKYIHSPKPELYDIVNDPHETKNLINFHPGVVSELHAGLEALLAGTPASEPTITDLSAAELEALTSLGYVSETPGTRVQNRANPADLIHLATIHQQGIAALRAGRHTQAVALFRKELEGDPNSPLVQWYLGCSLLQDQPAEASTLFRKAIELQPSFEEPYVELCEMSLRVQKIPALAPIADQGITNTQDQWGTLHYFRALGVIATGGEPDKPLADLSIAVQRARSPLRPLRLRALIYLQHQHNAAAALSELEALAPLLSSAELDLLYRDRTFNPLHGNERFEALFASAESVS